MLFEWVDVDGRVVRVYGVGCGYGCSCGSGGLVFLDVSVDSTFISKLNLHPPIYLLNSSHTHSLHAHPYWHSFDTVFILENFRHVIIDMYKRLSKYN